MGRVTPCSTAASGCVVGLSQEAGSREASWLETLTVSFRQIVVRLVRCLKPGATETISTLEGELALGLPVCFLLLLIPPGFSLYGGHYWAVWILLLTSGFHEILIIFGQPVQ